MHDWKHSYSSLPVRFPPDQLAGALDLSISEVVQGLAELEALYLADSQVRGLRLQRHLGRVQLTTAADTAPLIEKFLGLEATSRLFAAPGWKLWRSSHISSRLHGPRSTPSAG